jgi:hypothetical protein
MALTLERRSVAVGDHNIADRNAVGELVTHEYDGLPVQLGRGAAPDDGRADPGSVTPGGGRDSSKPGPKAGGWDQSAPVKSTVPPENVAWKKRTVPPETAYDVLPIAPRPVPDRGAHRGDRTG